MTEGLGLPAAVARFERPAQSARSTSTPVKTSTGASARTIWGAPDLDSAARQPRTTVISINRPDGEALIERLQARGAEVTLHAELREGWFPCPIVVADIPGQLEPERYVLVHGHYDSWDVGIGDNAVGDATLLELARIFHKHREQSGAWPPGGVVARPFYRAATAAPPGMPTTSAWTWPAIASPRWTSTRPAAAGQRSITTSPG